MLVKFANLLHGERDEQGRPLDTKRERTEREMIQNPFDLLKAAWKDMKKMGKTIVDDIMHSDFDVNEFKEEMK